MIHLHSSPQKSTSLSYQFLHPPLTCPRNFHGETHLLPPLYNFFRAAKLSRVSSDVCKNCSMHPPDDDDDDDLLPAINPSSRFRNLTKLNFFPIQHITSHHIAPFPFLFCPTGLISPSLAEKLAYWLTIFPLQSSPPGPRTHIDSARLLLSASIP